MHALEKKILSNLRRESLTEAGDKGIVAVSGGADSLALLLILHALRDSLGIRLEVLHFNHGLRPESPREADWVAGQAEALHLPFHLREADGLKKRPGGVQEAARNWRREESQKLLNDIGANWVATGHHLDDQTETILLKLMRGAHLSNLRGMRWRWGEFVRPLLNIGRAQLRGYLHRRGAEWLEDPSNQTPDYSRNRVRNELLPLMETISGGSVASHLAVLAAQAETLNRLLGEMQRPSQSGPAERTHWISSDQLARMPEITATAALHEFITSRMPGAVHHGNLSKAVDLLRSGRTAWSLHLSNGRTLRRAGERLILEPRAAPGRVSSASATPAAGVLELPGRRIEYTSGIELQICEHPCGGKDALVIHNLPPGCSLLVRSRADGDRFHPPWRNSPVKVKDFLRDRHVPLWRRDSMPCVVLSGQVIAIYPGYVARGFNSPQAGQPPLCLHASRP